jgi:hypothetical protein
MYGSFVYLHYFLYLCIGIGHISLNCTLEAYLYLNIVVLLVYYKENKASFDFWLLAYNFLYLKFNLFSINSILSSFNFCENIGRRLS